MTVEISAQTIITIGAVVTALIAIVGLFVKVVRFIDRQKEQDEEIKKNRAERETEISELREAHNNDIKAIKDEQTVLVYGVLACLKGLSEQGCNGPVTKAIEKLEKHLNIEAHK